MRYKVYVITRTSERDYVSDEYEVVVRYTKIAECTEHEMAVEAARVYCKSHPGAEVEIEE